MAKNNCHFSSEFSLHHILQAKVYILDCGALNSKTGLEIFFACITQFFEQCLHRGCPVLNLLESTADGVNFAVNFLKFIIKLLQSGPGFSVGRILGWMGSTARWS